MSKLKLDYLGKYRIIDEIGEGRFSIVYRSEHPFLKKPVAVKLMLPDLFQNAEFIQRFIQEVRGVAAIKHENLTPVIDLVEDKGYLFMVTEYLPGGDLHSSIKKNGRITFHQSARILADVAAALDYVHNQGFVHGDVKPGNILLAEDGSSRLSDLGVLHAVETSGAANAEKTRSTPAYISPEQADGGQPSPLSDQYALGVVAYELFAGRLPFDGENPLAIYLKHLREELPSPSQFNPLITPRLEAAISQALEKDPQKRFTNCRAFAQALGEAEAATKTEQYQHLIDRANAALADDDPDAAHPLIEAAMQIIPDEARPLIEDLQAREHAQRSYSNASEALNSARTNAQTLRAELNSPSDPDGVLAHLAPLPLPSWKALLLHWRFSLLITFSLGMLGLVLGIGGVVYGSLVPASSISKATLVAIARTPTPVPPTVTPTLTFTPTITLTPTLTFTPTSSPTLTPVPTIGIGSSQKRGIDGMVMVYVPAGSFIMGSDTRNDEQPVHTVTLDGYWIDQTEVTNAMFALCIQAGACAPKASNASFSRAKYYNNPAYAKFPVLHIDWNQAKAYCAWAGGRLPSEAQWEKAARGPDARSYPWGDGIDKSLTNYARTIGDTTQVADYENGKSVYNVYDMAGNVMEWVSSLYKPYPYDAADGREDLAAIGARGLRGGSWSDSDLNLRTTFRSKLLASNQGDLIGFRCAVDTTP
ncbi:MAG: bifunctional serine/threonine-protein kinase/formylglycine-generating enzyme family protein [Chloroflexi bacterium]|nr:bifunctional serine/threonine-protein kinase/formylglycine-generating enzyme family protein [Chloroflexota bacterium]